MILVCKYVHIDCSHLFKLNVLFNILTLGPFAKCIIFHFFCWILIQLVCITSIHSFTKAVVYVRLLILYCWNLSWTEKPSLNTPFWKVPQNYKFWIRVTLKRNFQGKTNNGIRIFWNFTLPLVLLCNWKLLTDTYILDILELK